MTKSQSALPFPFLDFYVPGQLVSGSDVSDKFPPELNVQDIMRLDNPSEVEGPVAPEEPPDVPQLPINYICKAAKFIQCIDCTTIAVSYSMPFLSVPQILISQLL